MKHPGAVASQQRFHSLLAHIKSVAISENIRNFRTFRAVLWYGTPPVASRLQLLPLFQDIRRVTGKFCFHQRRLDVRRFAG
jgi:hypothetical protein